MKMFFSLFFCAISNDTQELYKYTLVLIVDVKLTSTISNRL